jgi:cation diffusion facilitator CzcD-associated flavoprotein CzcO
MDSWLSHMPKGMLLKSDGFASNISDPQDQLTLKKFCAERRIQYSDTGIPVRLDTFTEYGLAFKERMVPELEDKMVAGVDHSSEGFTLRLEDGEQFSVQRLVLAVGITHFEYIPDVLSSLGPAFCSHSARHSDVEQFRGRSVVVIGGGSSALDWAGLLHEAGADVQLVARQESLKFHGKPDGKPRSLWQRITQPQSGLGPGWKSRFYADAPGLFHYLPEGLRVKIVGRALGPSGGWFIKDKVVGQIPLLLGHSMQGARVQNGRVQLQLRASDGTKHEISADHVIAATGYKVDLERLTFLSSAIRTRLKTVGGAPALSSSFESSVRGLYFVGVSAAISFGPVMRFAFGADFAARTVAHALVKSPSRQSSTAAVVRVEATK